MKTTDGDGRTAAGVAPAPACTMILFGAGGDLTKRLVVPALYNLVREGRLPDAFAIVGVDIVEQSTEAWREALGAAFRHLATSADGEFRVDAIDEDAWDWLAARMSYVQGDLTDSGLYRRLGEHLAALERDRDAPAHRLFYLAIADRFFAPTVAGLVAAGLAAETGDAWRRVIVEKPFGHDLASAQALNASILGGLSESQVYRIDHFLGKETVQNILALRFANGLFEPVWNRQHIAHVQITAAETVGVEARGSFYERTGALRDMVPNHLFQLLAMVAMEPPLSFDADAVRDRKSELLEAVHPTDGASAVRAQYAAGEMSGRSTVAYRAEPGVAPDSIAETYVALRLGIDNWRWAGVPFYLRTGKHLARRTTEIAIRFHQAPYSLFRGTDVERMNPNWLILRIQPDEGISLEFAAKRPGPTMTLANVDMDFTYERFFGASPDTGYETLLYDCMTGDATLFQRADNVEYGWRVVQPILDAWAADSPPALPDYAAGGPGPAAADALLAEAGAEWRPIIG